MLLRSHWSLIEADYTTCITALTHYTLPKSSEDPRSLVRDAIFLDRNRTSEAGATMIQQHSGRRPTQSEVPSSRNSPAIRAIRPPRHRQSPSESPGRLVPSQKQLEGLFQEVTGGLQRRTEGWNVSKAVRTAVGEVRRNMNNYQPSHSRQSSHDTARPDKAGGPTGSPQQRLQELQQRNVVLGKMLEDAVESLRSVKLTGPDKSEEVEQKLNLSLAKIQFVSVYLSDPDIPIPKEASTQASEGAATVRTTPSEPPATPISSEPLASSTVAPVSGQSKEPPKGPSPGIPETRGMIDEGEAKPGTRPSLMDSSFSFMLGENRHRSSFVSSVAALPEQRRDSESKSRPKQLSTEAKTQQERRGSESEDDGFTLTKIQGGR